MSAAARILPMTCPAATVGSQVDFAAEPAHPAHTAPLGSSDVSTGRVARPKFGWESLTETEIKVARLVAEGHTNRSAAAALFVSVNTISTHLRAVFSKLDVNSRVRLTRVALQHLSVGDGPPSAPHARTRRVARKGIQ
jgi:DNA-binding CsgD family transcriptional regulator